MNHRKTLNSIGKGKRKVFRKVQRLWIADACPRVGVVRGEGDGKGPWRMGGQPGRKNARGRRRAALIQGEGKRDAVLGQTDAQRRGRGMRKPFASHRQASQIAAGPSGGERLTWSQIVRS